MSETIFLEIKGMHCPDCPTKVKKSLLELTGVNQVTVDYESENGHVTYNDSLTNIHDITKRISEMGFEARNIQKNAKA